MELALMQIDWFLSRGYLLGEYKSRRKFYIIKGGATEEIEFDSIWQAQMYVKAQS